MAQFLKKYKYTYHYMNQAGASIFLGASSISTPTIGLGNLPTGAKMKKITGIQYTCHGEMSASNDDPSKFHWATLRFTTQDILSPEKVSVNNDQRIVLTNNTRLFDLNIDLTKYAAVDLELANMHKTDDITLSYSLFLTIEYYL